MIEKIMINFLNVQKTIITFIFNKFKPSTIAFFTSAGASAFWTPLILKMVSNDGIQSNVLPICLYFIGIINGLYLITLLEDLKEEVNVRVQQITIDKMHTVCKIPEIKKEALSGILDNPRSHNRIFYSSILFIVIILIGYITTLHYSQTQ